MSSQRERRVQRYVPMRNGSGRSRCGAMRAQVRRSAICRRLLLQVAAFERAQPAVNRPLMIERQAAAEVRALDERDRQPALRGVVGGKQPVNPAAHDQQIVPAACEILDVPRHRSQRPLEVDAQTAL